MKVRIPAAVVLAAVLPAGLFGHGVEVSNATAATASAVQIARFMYSTGEPMAYAAVHIFPPSTPDTESLQAITDRNGYFSFVPDEPGNWTLNAEDGMGHLGNITIPVQSSTVPGQESTIPGQGSAPNQAVGGGVLGNMPLLLRILLGLSLIVNVFAVYRFVLRRKITTPKEHSNAH